MDRHLDLDEIQDDIDDERVFDLVDYTRKLEEALREIQQLCTFNRAAQDDILPVVNAVLEDDDGIF